MFRNNRLPSGRGGWLGNFLSNFFWAIVWLGRSIIRLVKRKMK